MEQSKRSRRTSLEIKNLLEAFSQSGMSAKDFCMLHSISEAGFYKWRARYVTKSTLKENDFVLLHETSEVKNGAMLFAEVKGIRIYQAVAASYLKELLA
jgi:hypothetical protein